MKTVSQEYKAEAKSYARTQLAKFIIKDTNTVIDGEYIVSGFMQEFSFADDKIVGNTPAKNLEITVMNFDSIDYSGKELEFYTGLRVNGEEQYIKHGTFIVDSVEEDVAKKETKIKALDYMIKANSIFIDSLDWNVNRTLKEYANEVCSYCGLTLHNSSFPNEDYVLPEQPAFEGFSCRYILGKIAEIAGSIALINENNELVIKPLTISNESEDVIVDNIMEMEISETKYQPYNSVMLKLADGVEGENVYKGNQESIDTYGERCLTITGNEFAISETIRATLIEAIFSSVQGFFYTPISITYNSYDWLSRLDKINVYYDEENYYETYLLNHTIEFPSSIKSTIQNESVSETNATNKYVPVAEQRRSHTEIMVDKLNKKITAIVEDIEGVVEKSFVTNKTVSGNPINIKDAGNYDVESFVIKGCSTSNQVISGNIVIDINNGFNPTYDKYKEVQYIFDLNNEFIAQIGDVSDELDIVTGILTKRINADENNELFILEEDYEVQLDSTKIELFEGTNIINVSTNNQPTLISINYLLDKFLNSQYATRTQLELTQKSISSVVSETETLKGSVGDLKDVVDSNNTVLSNSLGDLKEELENNYATNESVIEVSNSVSNIQTSLNQQIAITKEIQVNGVQKVKTTTGFTFDENGLLIEKTGAETKTLLNENGMEISSASGSSKEKMLVANSTDVIAQNITVKTYLVMGNNSRLEDYEDGTGVFAI